MTIVIASLLLLSLLIVTSAVDAIEQPEYDVIDEVGELQIRKYQPHIVARTLVKASFSESGNQGFKRLAGYIFGGNGTNEEIAMTAPVGLQPLNEAPSESQFWVTFTMPGQYALDELPQPDDGRVDIAEVPERHLAVLRYRGNWSEKRYRAHEARLLAMVDANPAWTRHGVPSWSRYDPPFVPWFMRTNEVAIHVLPTAETVD